MQQGEVRGEWDDRILGGRGAEGKGRKPGEGVRNRGTEGLEKGF